MNEQKTQRIKVFVEKFFIKELKRLQDNDFHYFSFILIGEAIETLGGLLDKKPLKAKGQTIKRFTKGLNVLMPKRYVQVNDDNFLYDKLRNQMVHSFIPSSSLILTSRKSNTDNLKHLSFVDKKLVLVSEDFYEDLLYACNRLFYLLDKEIIKPKMIADFDFL